MTEPAALLRPLAALLQKAASPSQEEAREHAAFQFKLMSTLGNFFIELEEPLRLLRSSSTRLSRDDVERLESVSRHLRRCSASMAGPAWWKQLIFWKTSDGRQFVDGLDRQIANALMSARKVQPAYEQWNASKPHPQFSDAERPAELAFHARAQELNAERLQFEEELIAAQKTRENGAEFFAAWRRGRGFAPKRFAHTHTPA